jgi:hypothetical protein
MMPTPSGLYYLFGALMLAVAAYSVALLILQLASDRRSGWDVDVAHILMGVSMAGMFVTQWAFGPSAMWEFVFAVLLTWFVGRSVQSVMRHGRHLPHETIHAVMSLAMLLMYRSAAGSTASRSMSMSTTAARVDPVLAFVLAVTVLASAVFTLASPVKGVSHHGRHAPAYAMSGVISAPWLEDASHAVMCVGMAFILVLTF